MAYPRSEHESNDLTARNQETPVSPRPQKVLNKQFTEESGQ